MTIQEAYKYLQSQLLTIYDTSEAENIANLVIEHVTEKNKIDRIVHKQLELSFNELNKIENYCVALLKYKPVQYVLGETWFANMQFYVDENVLIPRPETEELFEWINETISTNLSLKTVVDIGTGSGCIPIAVKKKLPHTSIIALDISDNALQVAKKNASNNNVLINFMQFDFLNEKAWPELPLFDVIISNPPYIKKKESATMNENVLGYEPHLALFVEDNDALLFYRKIALFGKKHLYLNGIIFMEINEALGKETADLFYEHGYKTELRKDLQQKDRMLKAWL